LPLAGPRAPPEPIIESCSPPNKVLPARFNDPCYAPLDSLPGFSPAACDTPLITLCTSTHANTAGSQVTAVLPSHQLYYINNFRAANETLGSSTAQKRLAEDNSGRDGASDCIRTAHSWSQVRTISSNRNQSGKRIWISAVSFPEFLQSIDNGSLHLCTDIGKNKRCMKIFRSMSSLWAAPRLWNPGFRNPDPACCLCFGSVCQGIISISENLPICILRRDSVQLERRPLAFKKVNQPHYLKSKKELDVAWNKAQLLLAAIIQRCINHTCFGLALVELRASDDPTGRRVALPVSLPVGTRLIRSPELPAGELRPWLSMRVS